MVVLALVIGFVALCLVVAVRIALGPIPDPDEKPGRGWH